MNGPESIFYWLAALLLAATFFLSLISSIFKKHAAIAIARWALLAAFIALTVFGTIRWIRTGHPPFVTLFESMITTIWFVLLIFHIANLRLSRISVLILPVSLASFLLMGWSSSLPPEASPLSAALNNVWLFIHASFATAGAAAFFTGASFSALFLNGSKRLARLEIIGARIPDFDSLPGIIVNFLILGLILWGVMIASGSIWAHVAWGRYWAWDPIELWSLISWLIYGLLLHSRFAFKLPPRLFCWMNILAAAFAAFSLWGVHYFYATIHT